ncbi:MAG TPA: peptidylprolyl isomerase [Myxococcota bacterium]|nr:peptidylprolyl isomerase [Myxococcota bacterium]
MIACARIVLMNRLGLAFLCVLALASCRAQPPTGPLAVIRVHDRGEIRIELLPQLAPHHVANFTSLANSHFYDGTTFHRVIPKFMIQGGDPLSKDSDPRNDGTGGPGYFIAPEFSDSPHLPGTLSMARQSEPDTAGSQFFIMTTGSESWRPQLDRQYTVFGHVLSGQEIVDQISSVPRDRRDRPFENVVVDSIRVESPTPASAPAH